MVGFIRCLCIAFALISYSSANGAVMAGGWTSGGGELFGDGRNPWFIDRQVGGLSIVHYCIEVDEENFGVGTSVVRSLVRAAFEFWRTEFAAAHHPTRSLRYYTGLQSFFERPCTDDPPLRFKFGVLTEEELERFHSLGWNPKRFAGIAVRTHYDRRNLSGRGFIYISPESGPLSIVSPRRLSNPWRDSGSSRLAMVIRHELGHVFGVPHVGSDDHFMGEGFPEYAITSNMVGVGMALHSNRSTLFRPFQQLLPTQNCFPENGIPDDLVEFFAGEVLLPCISYRISAVGVHFYTSSSQTSTRDQRSLGVAVFTNQAVRYQELARLWLPEEQEVFPVTGSTEGAFIPGPRIPFRRATAAYRPGNGAPPRGLLLQVSPERLHMSAVIGQRMVLDFMGSAY